MATTLNKAWEINQDKKIYGTFAEIGAGQETARFFFVAGKASQTIAKTMSAYDMIYSDEIYGKEKSGRYVCKERLEKMVNKEFSLLQERLGPSRGANSTFFAFANTVATSSDLRGKASHGWIGVRFQLRPEGDHNDLFLHVRMFDKYRLMQQEALGILGVNLIHSAFRLTTDPSHFVVSLMENIKLGQVTIDTIFARGPDLNLLNSQILNLELVKRNYTDAVLFNEHQQVVDISDTLFNKPLVILRGAFDPITETHLELLAHGAASFNKDVHQTPIALFEMTVNRNQTSDSEQKILEKVMSITKTGHPVLVSRFFLFYRLKRFLRQFTDKDIALLIGVSLMEKMFDEKYYEDLEGGIMEGLGKLLDEKTRVFVLPARKDRAGSPVQSLKDYVPPQKLQSLYRYLVSDRNFFREIK